MSKLAAISLAASTLSQKVNAWIDNLQAAGERFLDLPLFVSLILLGAVWGLFLWIVYLWTRKNNTRLSERLFWGLGIGFALIAVAITADRKISRLQTALGDLRLKASSDAAALLSAVGRLEAKQRAPFQDFSEVQKALVSQFGHLSLRPLVYDEVTDLVQVQMRRPLVKVYLAVVDLRNPALEIKLGASLDKKVLTSVFARENECSLAINGEAGASPGRNSGLGPWRGFLVRTGEVLLREDPQYPAPYLAFDRQNRATFVPASSADRSLPKESYNVIWGRWDVLRDGIVQGGDSNIRQPRTAMGINKDGTFLYLLVADGRQPNYSVGLSRPAAGSLLKAAGAYNAMLCDEGGSSCIFLKQFGGIANVPAENYGQERPTYTHFGIRLKTERGLSSAAATEK